MKKLSEIKNDQNGLVAITVTVFFIVVLSLIVLAFSQVARREQRQALDRQLSSQAYYAAESGVNDAIEWIRTHPGTDITDCDGWSASKNLDQGPNRAFSYSCLLINQGPTSLVFGDIDVNNGETVSLGTPSGQQLKSVTFSWKETTAAGAPASIFTGCTAATNIRQFEQAGSYSADCDAGMLRIYLMPVSSGTNRQNMVNGSFSTFLRPVFPAPASSTVNYSVYGNSNSQGQVIAANCSTGVCTATVDNLLAAGRVYLHMRSIYKDNQVTITGTDTTGQPVRFNDAQAVIDSTGRASDVLRRVQVRTPIHPTFERSPYTIDSMNGICKRLGVYPGSATIEPCN
jgi:Tfp pilus assembly protein PilX